MRTVTIKFAFTENSVVTMPKSSLSEYNINYLIQHGVDINKLPRILKLVVKSLSCNVELRNDDEVYKLYTCNLEYGSNIISLSILEDYLNLDTSDVSTFTRLRLNRGYSNKYEIPLEDELSCRKTMLKKTVSPVIYKSLPKVVDLLIDEATICFLTDDLISVSYSAFAINENDGQPFKVHFTGESHL